MLTELHIHNFAIIDKLDLRFGNGLVILTGETGAGKSLLIDAIAPRPLILIGPEWQSIIHLFFTQMDHQVPESQRKWITFAPDIHSAVAML